MSDGAGPGDPSQWSLALRAAAILAFDPAGVGGIVVRARHGAPRDRWFEWLAALLPADTPQRRAPLGIDDARLLGGLDLAATLAAGRRVAERGVIEQADGGILVLPMAERIDAATASKIAAAMDRGEVVLERDGIASRAPSRFAIALVDESADPDEAAPAALLDRVGLGVDLGHLALADLATPACGPTLALAAAALARARERGARAATFTDDDAAAMLVLADRLGIASLRRVWWALRVAGVAAALDGRDTVAEADLALAAALSLAPFGARHASDGTAHADPTQAAPPHADPPPHDASSPRDGAQAGEPAARGDIRRSDAHAREPTAPAPAATPDDARTRAPDRASADACASDDADADPPDRHERADRILEAVEALMPPRLLDSIARPRAPRTRGPATGGARARGRSLLQPAPPGSRHGHRIGSMRPVSSRGCRLDLLATLRAAAPWQALRRRTPTTIDGIVAVRPDDFRIDRRVTSARTTIVFVVDASGSLAMRRLAQAKGAVESLLADCYVRRDQVALIAFRDRRADVLLAPTRSLVRARRSLAELPGGGATPLATGIDCALTMAGAIARRGERPVLVFVTDGQANIGRDGTPGRTTAARDAFDAASRLRASGIGTLMIDTAIRPGGHALRLAEAMCARYQPLPPANAASLGAVVREALAR
ncbi:MAG: VWA domain-containing protein [Lautropia sp.]